MREYEDTLKRKENKEMSLNEWKNNELNRLLMKKFGILKEADKPDYLDLDKDGDKEESMKDAAEDKKEMDEGADKNTGMSGVDGDDKGETYMGHIKEDSGEEEKEHYEDNKMSDEDHIKAIEHHLKALKKDKDYDDDHEELEETVSSRQDGRRRDDDDPRLRPMEENNPAGSLAASAEAGDDSDPVDHLLRKQSSKRVLKKKKIKLRFKIMAIIEVNNLKQLFELLNEKEEAPMREEIIGEAIVRKYVRTKIKSMLKEHKKNKHLKKMRLRKVIRELLKRR